MAVSDAVCARGLVGCSVCVCVCVPVALWDVVCVHMFSQGENQEETGKGKQSNWWQLEKEC